MVIKFKVYKFESGKSQKDIHIITLNCKNKFIAKNLMDDMFNKNEYKYTYLNEID